MLKRTLPLWFLLATLAAVPVLGRDFRSWRDDASGIVGTGNDRLSINQQTSHQAFNLYDSGTVAGDSTYSLFWEGEHTTNGGQTNPPFGDEPPSVAPDAANGVKDNRSQADEQNWTTWAVVTSKATAPPRPTFTPQVPQAWNPLVVDLGDTSVAGELADHALLSVSFEPEPPAGSTGRLREQILNVYYPGTAEGLPGNATSRSNEERGTVRPFWLRGGNRLTPGLRLRDLAPLRDSLSNTNPGVGAVTQPPIFARVTASYRRGSSDISETLPVVFLVVGTGENGDPARVICLSLKKPASQRTNNDTTNAPLPTRGQIPDVGFTEPPDPDFFDPTGGGGGQVMWSYTVTGRAGGSTPVAGVSFANVVDVNDRKPLLFVTTADGQLICLNAKAADIRGIGDDSDPAIVPNNPAPRWRWTTPTLFPGTPEEETPGFSYGQAPAVARVPIAGAFSSNNNDPSSQTAARALAHGHSDWVLFVADTYGTFRAFDAPGMRNPLSNGARTSNDPSVRWVNAPANTFRLDPQGIRERFIIPPLVYQGNTPLNAENGALVSGSSDVGFDDEVIFTSERGNLYALDCLGEFRVNANSAAIDGTPTGATAVRWRFPQDDTAYDPVAGTEPLVWPRELPDPFSDRFIANGSTTDPYGNALSTSERALGKAINTTDTGYDGYYTRGPLAVTLGADANPNNSVPNLDPGDDSIFVPYLAEQPDTTIKIGPTTTNANPSLADRTITKPAGHRWFYEYIGSMKPYGFVQMSRPIKELRSARTVIGGQTVNIPLNRLRVGTIKYNGLPSTRVQNILAPGPVGANPNFNVAGPTPEDTVYLTSPYFYDDANQAWRTIPLGSTITFTYIPPRSATDSANGTAVTETLVYPSCYRAVPAAAAPYDVTQFDVVRERASLTVDHTRLEQRLLQRAREATGTTPARPNTLYEEDPALVPTDEFTTYDSRQPGMMAAGSQSLGGTLMAPALYRGRIIALNNRLDLYRVILGNFHPTILQSTADTTARPVPTNDGVNPEHYGPPSATLLPATELNTYDPGEFYPDDLPPFGALDANPAIKPFLEDEVKATDVAASVALVDGWMYVTYRNGHTRGYANAGGSGVGTSGNPPYFQLPPPAAGAANLVEAPLGDLGSNDPNAAQTGIYILTKVVADQPVPTLTLNDVLDQTVSPPRIRSDVRPLHRVANLDRSVMLEWGQTLFVAVDFGPNNLLATEAGATDANDDVREIDPQIMEAGNEIQGQIRSNNGAVQQLPGLARGVLPTLVDHDGNAATPPHIMAVVPIFCGVPSPSNPLTPGTPMLWEKQATGGNPYDTFANDLTYDIQITQQGVQWRWPDDMTTGQSTGVAAGKQHYWESERNDGAVRFPDTAGTTTNAAGGPPKWTWINNLREWAPLLSFNNPFIIQYDPVATNDSYQGMLAAGGPTNTVTLIDQYNNRNDSGRRNGDPYEAFTGVIGRSVDGARSGNGRPVVPIVGTAYRTGQVRSQQLLFGEHGKATPVSTTVFPDLAKLRVADRSYMSFVGRTLATRVQRAALTKIGKGADYGTRGVATLRNLTGAPAGSFDQNINTYDDGPDQLYPSIADSRLMVSKLGTNLDLGSSPVGVPGRVLPDTAGAFPAAQPGGLPLVTQMETLAVQVDIPLYTPDDLYSTRWRGSDTAAGSSPNTAFNPFFPGALFGDAGRALWDRAERRSRTPALEDPANTQEQTSLTSRGEDLVSPAAADQDDRTRRVMIFNDANNNGQLDLLPNYREAYRTFAVQVMVKPELKIEAQQAAIDLGNLWHGKQQPGADSDNNPATNPQLDIREWQRMVRMQLPVDPVTGTANPEWVQSLGNFYQQFWRPITLLNTGNVNLGYVKPELAYQTAATGVQLLAIPSEGNDPWRALPLLNGVTGNPNPLIDPQQIFLRSSFDDQLLPNTGTAYGAGTRGVWLQKATVGAAAPGVVAYADDRLTPSGNPADRDPGPATGAVAHPVQGQPRPTFISLNVPTGAALGQYSGSIRFYNDRSVALQEDPTGTNFPVGYRYINPTGTDVSRNGVLDRRNDGEPLEPVTDPPFQIRARVVENVAYGRSRLNGNALEGDRAGERRQRPAVLPDFSAISSTGTARRVLLAWAGNRSGIDASQPSIYDLFGSRMEMDTNRSLFPFDQVPMLRPQGADFTDPWWEMTNAANAGFSLLTNVTNLGVNAQATSPSLSQEGVFTQSALLAWSERRTLSLGQDQYRFLYQMLSPTASTVQELLPGGVPATAATPRLNPRILPVLLENQNGATTATTWLAFWATGPAQRRNLAFSYHWDPQTGQLAAKQSQGEFPAGNLWAPENTLSGSKAFSTMSSPHAIQTYGTSRLPGPLPNLPEEPPYIQQENARIPASTWVSFAGSSQRLARTDIYLSRYRTNALLASRSRGGSTDPLAAAEDYSHVRFPRNEAYGANGVALGGDTLEANANRTLYTASGSDWLIKAYSPVQFYLARPDLPAGSQGSLTRPLPLLNVGEVAPESPTGELLFPLSDALRNTPGLERFKLMVDPAAGTVRLTGDIRTLAARLSGLNAFPAQLPDPVLRADYTAATIRLTRAGASASDPVVVPVTSSMQPQLSPAAVQYYDASWYRQQIDGGGTKWVAGTPVAGIADRLWVFWRRAAGATAAAPTSYYKVLRPGIRVSLRAIYGIQPGELQVQVGGSPVTAEEVDPQTGQIYFPLNFEGQRVQVSYRGPSGETFQEQHIVSWIDETGELQVPMNSSVNEGSLDGFASFEEVPMTRFGGGNNTTRVRKMERMWLFWSSTRGSGGDIVYAALAPRLGPEVNVNGSVALFAGNPARLQGLAPNVVQERLALAAALERRRPFTLPTITRRGPLAPLPARPVASGR